MMNVYCLLIVLCISNVISDHAMNDIAMTMQPSCLNNATI